MPVWCEDKVIGRWRRVARVQGCRHRATSHYTRVGHVGSGRVQHMSNCTRAYNTTKHMCIIQLYTCVLYNYTRVGRITDTWIMDESTTAVFITPIYTCIPHTLHVYTVHSTCVYCTVHTLHVYTVVYNEHMKPVYYTRVVGHIPGTDTWTHGH